MFWDEKKQRITVREKVNTTVKSGGKKSTATNVVQMETMREYCPLLAVNPEIQRIKTPHLEEGTVAALSTVLHETVEEYDSLKKLKVVGSDSTNKMRGLNGGTQTLLEQNLKRSRQRIFCRDSVETLLQDGGWKV